jgi:hypothetical protein
MNPQEVMEAPNIVPLVPAMDQRWLQEYREFDRMLPELMKTYRDRFVAIYNGGVVAVADTFTDTALEAYKKVGYVPLHVGLVTEKSPVTARLPSPRIRQAGVPA